MEKNMYSLIQQDFAVRIRSKRNWSYSIIRTVTAVERADVVLVVIDAAEGVTKQDAKIAGIAHERGKGVIIVVNKWDAIEKNDKTTREYEHQIRMVLSFLPYAEIMYMSALTGQRLRSSLT